jgi:DNA-binding MarR family transcriptional regulator
MALATEDGQSRRQRSARLGIHRNAMVSVIDALEADGLVERMTHPDDRRAFAITLTDQARSLLPDLDNVGPRPGKPSHSTTFGRRTKHPA